MIERLSFWDVGSLAAWIGSYRTAFAALPQIRSTETLHATFDVNLCPTWSAAG
jgi:hypothetical protein